MTTVELLKGARELVSKGWTQGVYSCGLDGAERYCMDGALFRTASGQDASISSARCYLLQATPDTPLRRWLTVVGYNDAKSRTQTEVVETFDRAIALAEADAV